MIFQFLEQGRFWSSWTAECGDREGKVDVIRSCFSPEWEHVVHQIPIKSRKSESMCSGSYQVKEVMREFSAMGPM